MDFGDASCSNYGCLPIGMSTSCLCSQGFSRIPHFFDIIRFATTYREDEGCNVDFSASGFQGCNHQKASLMVEGLVLMPFRTAVHRSLSSLHRWFEWEKESMSKLLGRWPGLFYPLVLSKFGGIGAC